MCAQRLVDSPQFPNNHDFAVIDWTLCIITRQLSRDSARLYHVVHAWHRSPRSSTEMNTGRILVVAVLAIVIAKAEVTLVSMLMWRTSTCVLHISCCT